MIYSILGFMQRTGLLLGVVALVLLSTTALAADKPNVILIITDDMGWGDPGSYGFDRGVKTPQSRSHGC